jgi:hypothetical protein
MIVHRRWFAPLAALVTATYVVCSLGCTAARVGHNPAGQQAGAPVQSAVSYAEAAGGATPASYAEPASDCVISSTPDEVAPGSMSIDRIVRGQNDHGYGPIREFLISPYTIGAIFIAALVVPAAIEGDNDP